MMISFYFNKCVAACIELVPRMTAVHPPQWVAIWRILISRRKMGICSILQEKHICSWDLTSRISGDFFTDQCGSRASNLGQHSKWDSSIKPWLPWLVGDQKFVDSSHRYHIGLVWYDVLLHISDISIFHTSQKLGDIQKFGII